MRFLFLVLFFLSFQCSKPTLNNPSDFASDAFQENETILCLTGQSSFCQGAIPVCTTCRFFSTSLTYNGDRGGIAGADAKCMSDAKKPPLPAGAVYKAFLVDDVNRVACTTANCATGGNAEHLNWILKPNTNYVRAVDNATITTTNSFGIFSSQTNDAEISTITGIFSGFQASGWTTRMTGGHCNRWMDGTNTPQLSASSSNQLYIASGGILCDTSSVILCVEQ
ncbi:DUF1554 domain-containing protein [Leptospira sp. WS39.C2]